MWYDRNNASNPIYLIENRITNLLDIIKNPILKEAHVINTVNRRKNLTNHDFKIQ